MVHFADQGSINTAGIYFLQNHLGYYMLLLPDPNHRMWNDIKGAAQKCTAYLWRTMVLFTLVFNLNYSPFGKGAWFDSKKDWFTNWAATATIEDPWFRKYAHAIAEDHKQPPPQTEDEYSTLLELAKAAKSMEFKGPLVKLMRWFSWFESWEWYRDEIHTVKMVLEAFMHSNTGSCIATETLSEKAQAGDAQQELRDLKEQFGGWSAAFQCITPDNVWKATLLYFCVQPLYTSNTQRVQTVKGPEAALAYEVSLACGGWQEELNMLVAQTLRNPEAGQELGLLGKDEVARQRIAELFDFVTRLAQRRVQALAHHSAEPPRSLCAILQSDAAASPEAIQVALEEWKYLLNTETLHRRSAIPVAKSPLTKIVWPQSRLVRYMFLLLEAGQLDQARDLLQRVFSTLGDEKIIEDLHQHVRDIDRNQRHNSRGLSARFAQVIHSQVLEGKHCTAATPEEAEVVQACTTARPLKLAASLRIGRHARHCPLEWQQIMGRRSWQSPTPESLFVSTAAHHWMCHWWKGALADVAQEAQGKAQAHNPWSRCICTQAHWQGSPASLTQLGGTVVWCCGQRDLRKVSLQGH